jgi:hypothetical protein
MSAAGARLAALALLALLGAGCAPAYTTVTAVDGKCLPAGRILVVAKLVTDENRANAETVADLLVAGLQGQGQVIGVRQFRDEANASGLGVLAATLSDRLQRGGGLTLEEGRTLAERFDIRTIVTTELREYDQVWGKYAKFTRAAVGAQAVEVGSDQVIWRLRSDTEVEAMRGRAFRYAMEQSVQELAGSICPTKAKFSVTETWRSFRR